MKPVRCNMLLGQVPAPQVSGRWAGRSARRTGRGARRRLGGVQRRLILSDDFHTAINPRFATSRNFTGDAWATLSSGTVIEQRRPHPEAVQRIASGECVMTGGQDQIGMQGDNFLGRFVGDGIIGRDGGDAGTMGLTRIMTERGNLVAVGDIHQYRVKTWVQGDAPAGPPAMDAVHTVAASEDGDGDRDEISGA